MGKNIFRKMEIEAYQGVDKSHFLNGNARRTNKSIGDLAGLTGIGFHIIEIQPGYQSTELHRHYYEDECVYVLDGEAIATIGGDEYAVKAGDFIGYPAGGDAHMLVNCGQTILRCIVVGQRLDHDVADYPRLDKRIFRNKNRSWNLVDLANIEEPVAGRKI